MLRLIASAIVCLVARQAVACAPCNCGDSTLTVVGIEQAYKNRVRLALDERLDTHEMGDARSQTLRTQLALAWSPLDRLTLAVSLPWIDTWIAEGPSVHGLGDLELVGRATLWRNRRFAPEHVLWLTTILKTPTGPRVSDPDGYPVPEDDQPGSGSWDPGAALSYGWFGGLTSVFLSATGRGTTPNDRGYRRGALFSGAASIQVQPWKWFATSLGADVIWREHDTLKSGAAAPDTGGTTLRVLTSLLFSPHSNVLLRLGVAIPFAQVANGRQSEGPQILLSMAWDIK
jgi:hypothetical protein